jgi:hypothetical protein
MCTMEGCSGVPYSTAQFVVELCHAHGGWRGERWATTVSDDGEILQHAKASIEFGPFDSWTEVGHWLSSGQSVLRGLHTAARHAGMPSADPA